MVACRNSKHFRLEELGNGNFRPIIRNMGIIGDVLGFEGGDAIPCILDDFTDDEREGRFACVGGGAEDGDGGHAVYLDGREWGISLKAIT